MSRVVEVVGTRGRAEKRCAELGSGKHLAVPSMGGYDVVELDEQEQLEAERQHFIKRAEHLERCSGVSNVMARVSPRSAEMLLAKARSEIEQAMKLRERAAAVGQPKIEAAP